MFLSQQAASRSILVLASVFFSSIAFAQTTWYVDAEATGPGSGTQQDPYNKVRVAIGQTTTTNGDTLSVAPGVYVENIDFLGKEIRVVSQAGPSQTTLMGNFPWSVVQFKSGETANSQLLGFTITGGLGQPNADFSQFLGGGVFIENASPTIEDCVFEQNDTENGSGLYAFNSNTVLKDCLFQDNGSFSSFRGGALFFEDSTPHLQNLELRTNKAQDGSGGYFLNCSVTLLDSEITNNLATGRGGGLAFNNCAAADILRCEIQDNLASQDTGGGIYALNSVLEISHCTVNDNVSEDDHDGGGLFVDGGSLHFQDGEIRNNFARRGGGVHISGAGLFERTRIQNNTADAKQTFVNNFGGGLYAEGLGTLAVNCVFSGNSISGDFGGLGEGAAAAGLAELVNCTLTQNVADTSTLSGSTTLKNCIQWGDVSLGATPINPNTQITYSNIETGFPGVGNIDQNPIFWSTADLHLMVGSPSIDAGDPNDSDADGSVRDQGAFPFDSDYNPNGIVYCTAKPNSLGCTPQIAFSGQASQSAPADNALVSADQVLSNKAGLLFWGFAESNLPFVGGTLCVAPPLRRTALQFSGGNPGNDCSGSYAFAFTQSYMQSQSVPLGAIVHAQYWSRDPGFAAPDNAGLTNAVKFAVIP